MGVVVWSRAGITGLVDPMLDELIDVDLLVLEDVTAADDPRLAWCRRAPCVVAASGAGLPPASVDLVGDRAELEQVAEAVAAHPRAARTLVDVLRVVDGLDVDRGLVVESLAYSALMTAPEHQAWLAGRPRPRTRELPAELVRVARDGDERLTVTLADPARRNAFSAPMRDALCEALAVAEVDPTIREVVIDAEGPVFSSGGDLDEFGSTIDVVSGHQIRTHRSVGRALFRLGDRATVRVHGRCVGAGVELPAFAAHVVADPAITFRLPEVSMGLIPGAGGTVGLTRRIGRQPTAWLALTGQEVNATWAHDHGLVDAIEPQDR